MEAEEGSWKASSSSAPALSPQPPPSPPPSSSKLAAAPTTQRQRFFVELRPGETTIVSWKRLLKESNKASKPPPQASAPPSGAHPALESRIAPAAGLGPLVDGDRKDALPPPNRFSAVIEKIERLYMGQDSNDEEELDDVPDEDEYDTDDSFIDDAELDEYFEVDKSATKHNGYFVNRGKLERINEPASSDHAPKKRRRKDFTKDQNQADDETLPNGHVKIGNVHAKAAAKSGTLMGSKLSSSSKISLSSSENCRVKSKNQSKAPLKSFSKKSTDSLTKSLNPSVEALSKDVIASSSKAKHLEQRRINVVESRDLSNNLKVTTASDECISIQNKHCSRNESNYSNERKPSSKIRQNEKNGSCINASRIKNPVQAAKSQFTSSKESSGLKPKGMMLEQAIQELEKIVAESRPLTSEVQEADGSSQGVKRRLPLDVKQKLAKVARLASSHGRIPEELINRLMGIVGHVMQLKTLKRNLKKMVESGLSAMQEKENRFQQVKKEIAEMIKIQSCLKSSEARQQVGSSDDFQDMPHGSDRIGKYSIDDAVENKLCEIYDLYVEGMEEDKSSEIRKLCVELAELWPSGTMDRHGIKKAIRRAKERKRILDSQLKEKIGRKKISAAVKTNDTRQGEASANPQLPSSQERFSGDSCKASVLAKKPVPKSVSNPITSNLDLPTSSKISKPSSNPFNLDRPSPGKVRVSVNMVDEGGSAKPTDVEVMKKKSKRKPESDMVEGLARPFKLSSPSQHGEERYKSTKVAVSRPHKSSHPSAILQGCE